MSTMLCGDEVYIASRIREKTRDDIICAIRHYGRPVLPIEVERVTDTSHNTIGKMLSQLIPNTFVRYESTLPRVAGRRVSAHCVFYIGLHPHLARHEPTYNEFGHLGVTKSCNATHTKTH